MKSHKIVNTPTATKNDRKAFAATTVATIARTNSLTGIRLALHRFWSTTLPELVLKWIARASGGVGGYEAPHSSRGDFIPKRTKEQANGAGARG
jgi:hypothetical protein